MKSNTFTIFIMSISFFCAFAIACSDDVPGASNTNSDTNSDADSESDSDKDKDSDKNKNKNADTETVSSSATNKTEEYNFDPDVFNVPDCITSCELHSTCQPNETASYLEECKKECAISIPLLACLHPYIEPPCQQIMADYYDCTYSMASCEDVDSFTNAMLSMITSGTVTNEYMCAREMEAFINTCEAALDSLEETDSEIQNTCADELAAAIAAQN